MLKILSTMLINSLLFLLQNTLLSAQPSKVLVHKIYGDSSNDWFGYAAAGAGDIDGDGKDDFIVGAPLADPEGLVDAGSAYVFSGASGTLLCRLNGQQTGDQFGSAVAGIGDIDGDGIGDFLIGAPFADSGSSSNAGSAFIYSGQRCSLLVQKFGTGAGDLFGLSVSKAGQIDSDNIPDYIIGAPYTFGSDNGSIYVYSGLNDTLIFKRDGGSSYQFGSSIAGGRDLNGDGVDDFVVGAPNAIPNNQTAAGSVFVYSGASGDVIVRRDGGANFRLGYSVGVGGDMDGNGKSEYIIGVPGISGGAGEILIYSILTDGIDSLLFMKIGDNGGDVFGFSVAGTGDINGDGIPDFIVGAVTDDPNGKIDAGSAVVYSGATGGELFRINGDSANDNLGWSVADAGDLNGDGRNEIVIGAYLADTSSLINTGAIFVYRLCAATRGDLNFDNNLSPSDLVLMLNCVFLVLGNCDICFADVSCDGLLTPTDVVKELNAVFLREPIVCLP